ncbi:hypothetical protein BB561_002198 [Smittium simulii]|uniref:Uncharacterized protein n=1 Tax=Smittium simulii TaxID=133385 RepID=A0A2T9YRA6_9FUNG|nr:hypothetical protein BB561_002198 [Smittium simulii]
MFGCLVAGRLVQTNLEQVAENKFIFKLEQPHLINHLVVFLLGTVSFPEGYAATVHFKYPQAEWVYLGAVSNDKPSAIFRLGKKDPAAFASPDTLVAEIGISVETVQDVASTVQQNSQQTQLVSSQLSPPNPNNTAVKILQNLYDYLMSFATKQAQNPVLFGSNSPLPNGTQVIPAKAVEEWYKSYSNKISRGDI